MTRTAGCWDWVRPFQSPNSLYFGQQQQREEHDPAIATCGQRNKKTEADYIWPQFAEAATTCSGRKTLAQFQTGCCPGVAPARDRGGSGKKTWKETSGERGFIERTKTMSMFNKSNLTFFLVFRQPENSSEVSFAFVGEGCIETFERAPQLRNSFLRFPLY